MILFITTTVKTSDSTILRVCHRNLGGCNVDIADGRDL
jgi:hypothetical protein